MAKKKKKRETVGIIKLDGTIDKSTQTKQKKQREVVGSISSDGVITKYNDINKVISSPQKTVNNSNLSNNPFRQTTVNIPTLAPIVNNNMLNQGHKNLINQALQENISNKTKSDALNQYSKQSDLKSRNIDKTTPVTKESIKNKKFYNAPAPEKNMKSTLANSAKLLLKGNLKPFENAADSIISSILGTRNPVSYLAAGNSVGDFIEDTFGGKDEVKYTRDEKNALNKKNALDEQNQINKGLAMIGRNELMRNDVKLTDKDKLNLASARVKELQGADDSKEKWKNFKKSVNKNIAKDTTGEFSENIYKKAFGNDLNEKSYITDDSFGGKAINTIGQGFSQFLMSYATGSLGGASSSKLAKRTLEMAPVAVSGYGSGLEEAYNITDDEKKAQMYALGSATIEVLTEAITGSIPGLGENSGIDYIANKGINKISNRATRELTRMGYRINGEGFEEGLANVLDTYLKQKTIDPNAKLDWSSVAEDYMMGAISAGTIELPTNIANTRVAIREQNAKNQLKKDITPENAQSKVEELIEKGYDPKISREMVNESLKETNQTPINFNDETIDKNNIEKTPTQISIENVDQNETVQQDNTNTPQILQEMRQNQELSNETINTPQTVETPKNNIKSYTENDINRFSTGNNLIDGVNSDLKSFTEKFYDKETKRAKKKKAPIKSQKMFLGRISDALSTKINSLLNNSGRFSQKYETKDTNIVISSDNIEHIYNHHGSEKMPGQIDVTPENLSKYADVVSNPDYIGLSSQLSRGNTPTLYFTKKINGYSVAVEVLSTKKQLYPQSYYVFDSNSKEYIDFIKNNKLKKAWDVESGDFKSSDINVQDDTSAAFTDNNDTTKTQKSQVAPVSSQYSMQQNKKIDTETLSKNVIRELENSSFSFKQKQLDIINRTNPADDDVHTWIRTVEDIKTFDEAFFEDGEFSGMDPDFTETMAKNSQGTGKIIVYSSYPIENGVFVSPSKMEASQYAGGDESKLYSKEVDINDVAWIDGAEGQYARVDNNNQSAKKVIAPIVRENNEINERIEKDDTPNVITYKVSDKITRKQVRQQLLDEMDITAEELSIGDDINPINFQLTDPIRVNEKVFGRELGKKINEGTIQKTKHNTAEKTRWLNLERNDIKQLGIKPRSKESAAVQKYGEKQYVNKYGEIVSYGDVELANEFSNTETQEKIKRAAEVIRNKYDKYIDQINEVITALGYDEIPKRTDYMRHFQELGDIFSQTGVPFNLNDMKAEDLPTDINGLTEFNKPGKNWFASAQKRTGIKTTYDAITGIDGYLEGAGNLIYHTADIQRYRALSTLIRDNFGQSKGFENLDNLTNEHAMQRIKDIQNNKFSRYAAWLDEQANSLAGKKGTIDRGVERAIGRRGYTFLNTLKKQVGSNMTGFNVRSALTNLISSTIASAKTNKIALTKGTISTIHNMFKNDGFINKSDFLTSRFGSDSLSPKLWQKLSNAGQIFMTGTDYFTSNLIVRSKYYEGLQKGMTESEAIEYADDFGARVMGDRSQGSTAEAFNSKTLGLFTQFQLEVNNQWQYMIHDTKMDYQKNSEINGGLKAGATALFQMGQLAGFSYLFNEFFETLTGSRAAFDPIEILKSLFDDDNEESLDGKIAKAGELLVDNIPFGNLITGGGRIPISEAFNGPRTFLKKITNQKNTYGGDITWKDVGNDVLETLPYYILPTGYNQSKKTIKGLSMFSKDKEVTGSYTKSGNLRFPVENTTENKIQAGLFGEYASKNAREYFDDGNTALKENQQETYKTLNIPISDYWKLDKEIKNIKKRLKGKPTEERKDALFNYIENLNINEEQKEILKKLQYKSYRESDFEIIEYINSSNVSKKTKKDMLERLGLDD